MALRLAGEGYAEGGVTEFLGLSDTPISYSGQGGKYAKVHAVENALEFDTPSGGGDMLKSVYDIDLDGVVDNSEKLEGSTKAQVQDHNPKAHTHTESEITDLEHDAVKLQGRNLDSAAPADGQVVTWEQATSEWKPKTPAGGGDMLKSVYDTDDDGVVDNSEKLEGSTKAQVQDHDPKAHTHTESEITDLEHDAVKLQGRNLDSGAPADGQVVTWEQATSKWKPKTPAGGGDMLKSIYDSDDDGIVDNSEKLEGSTKAQVQDHDPKAHAASHQNAGTDEISVAGLSGELADPQPPKAHASAHADGGSDEITSALDPGAYPMLADVVANRPAAGVAGRFFWATDEGILYRDNGASWDKVAVSDYPDLDDIPSSFTPSAHKASHENGGADEIGVAGLSGELADLQKVKDHTHQSAGGGAGGKLDHGLALDGLGDDDHAQYLNNARHDTTARHPLGTVVPHDALANLTEKAHSSLTGIGASDHHEKTVDASELSTGNLPAARLGGILTTQGDVLIRDATGPTRLGAGTDGQFLKTQGAGANPVWADVDGGSFDIFDKFREIITWGSLDGWETGGEGTVEAAGHVVRFKTTAAVDSDCYLKFKTAYSEGLEAGKKLRAEFFIEHLTNVTDQYIWARCSYGADDPPSDTRNHVGFKIDGADIYATNANGTSSTSTDTLVDAPSGAQMTRLRLEFIRGTNCKFYVNGVLKATHTTNLPDIAGWGLHLAVRALAADAKWAYFGRVLIEQEY